MGVDATKKWASEGYAGRWPDEIKMDGSTKSRVNEIWKQLGLGDLKGK
jgi:4-hydroxy-3-polyprenylbenzoate decarboxylase